MPTLGFLKKKRTKESKDPHHASASPTSESVTTSTPTTASSTEPFRESVTSVSSTSSQLPSSIADSAKSDGPMSLVDQGAPSNDIHQHQSQPQPHQQQQYTSAPAQTSSLPYPQSAAHINNLINPPQAESTTKEYAGEGNSTGEVQNNAMAASAVSTSLASNVNASASRPTPRVTKGKYQLTDFIIQRTLGTGSFGRVHLVQSRHNQRFYAVKVLKKQQVVKMKQVEHTNDERRMLGMVKHPFLITLWGTFQDSKNLYMVMDFIEGGELFSLLRKSQVSFCPLSRSWDQIIRGTSNPDGLAAISKPCCKILCRRGDPCTGLPAFDEHCVS